MIRPLLGLIVLFLTAGPLVPAEKASPPPSGHRTGIPSGHDQRRLLEKLAPRKKPPKVCKPLRVFSDELGLPALDTGHQDAPVSITGELLYPTPFVLAHLGLEQWQSAAQRSAVALDLQARQRANRKDEKLDQTWLPPNPRGKKILSIAEGTGGLVPFLNAQGADATGVDLAYFQPHDSPPGRPNPWLESMKSYEARHQDHLKHGNALGLDFPEKSFDMVVSSFLLNNFENPADRRKAVSEGFRVLRPGGTLRFTFPPREKPSLEEARELIKDLPAGSYELLVLEGPVGVDAKPDADPDAYPADSLPWNEMQQRFPKLTEGQTLPLCQVQALLSKTQSATLVLKRIK